MSGETMTAGNSLSNNPIAQKLGRLWPLQIPADWDNVTPGWMTRALSRDFPDSCVSTVKILMRDDGTNRRAKFALRYQSGVGPTQVFVKAHSAHHRIVHLRNGNLFNEARLFSSGAELPLDHPRVYTAKVDYLRLDFLLVMEDLMQREADPRDSTRPMSVEQVAHGLRALARLHSRYWNFSGKTHANLAWVKTWKASPGWQVGLAKCVPRGLQRGMEQLPGPISALSGDHIVKVWSDYVNTLAQDNVTLLHGDAHIGNTYVLPDNQVGFLDWQVVRRGNWSQDVGYFLAGSIVEDDRRRAERALLDEYRNALELPRDQLPSRDDIWLRYRQSQAYGLAIWLSTLGTDGYQSQAISLALAQRYASAFIELESEKALRGI